MCVFAVCAGTVEGVRRLRTRVVGRPGGHAGRLARQRFARAALFAAVAAAAVWLGWAVSSLRWPALVVAVAAASATRTWWGRCRQAAVGADAERRVGRVLARSGARAVLHSVMLGAGGDADHLLVGPQLVAVETKYGRGRPRYRDGVFTVGGRRLPRDPVLQVRRQAAAVFARTGVRCDAIVCVSQMTGKPFKVGDVVVCSLRSLAKMLDGVPPRLSDAEARRVVGQLAPLCGLEEGHKRGRTVLRRKAASARS